MTNSEIANRGWVNETLAKAFGANWKPAVSGWTAMAMLAIHAKPQLIQWIPEPTRSFVWNLSEYAFAAGFLFLATRSKDKATTGGSVQQTIDGKFAKPGAQDLVDMTKQSTEGNK